MANDQKTIIKGGLIGGLFGGFIFPVLWQLACYAIPIRDAHGHPIKYPGLLLSIIIMIPMAISGALVFGLVGALAGYVLQRFNGPKQ